MYLCSGLVSPNEERHSPLISPTTSMGAGFGGYQWRHTVHDEHISVESAARDQLDLGV